MKNRIYILIVVLILAGTMPQGYAQGMGTVKGKVINLRDSSAIVSAMVNLDSTSYYTVTDSNGAFELQNIPEGKYRIHAFRGGFYPIYWFIDITVTPDALTTMDLKMESTEGLETGDPIFIMQDGIYDSVLNGYVINSGEATMVMYKWLRVMKIR